MPSRISGACTPCRSKKQKCSGHHPTCSQCATSSIDCTWPEQRKRGPAKGYIEALESRLHSAESLLLALLPMINDNTIEQAAHTLQHDDDEDINGIGGRRSSPPLLNKKTGQDYWELFPIDTRNNIRKWQYDCEANSNQNNLSMHHNRSISAPDRRYKSPTRSPISPGIPSPHDTTPIMSQHQHPHPHPHQHQQQHHNNGFLQQPMQHYMTQNQMQTGAAHQLLSLSNQSRGDQWMTQPNSDMMQLDPSLMQPRSMPQQLPHVYAGNQPTIFW